MIDPRTVFFLGASALCALLIPVCPEKFRWVGWTVTVAYLVLAVLGWLDHLSRHGRDRKR